jgi:hypothetical protein
MSNFLEEDLQLDRVNLFVLAGNEHARDTKEVEILWGLLSKHAKELDLYLSDFIRNESMSRIAMKKV